ncbi:hypothetical protein TURU_055814 [Turdus rufiventris]|nr:hypothetical protein TURU_055814 [Turdus rufiventris]
MNTVVAAQKTNRTIDCIQSSMATRARKGDSVPLFPSHELEHCIQLWGPQNRKDKNLKNEWSCGREEKALEKEKVAFLDFIAKETNKPNTNAAVQIEGSQETSKFRGTEEKDISNESP